MSGYTARQHHPGARQGSRSRLRELRAARQWSQAQLADLCSVSRQTIFDQAIEAIVDPAG